MKSLLTDEAISAAQAPARYRRVSYPRDLHLHGQMAERLLFARPDDYFANVDWTNFDPERELVKLPIDDDEKAYIKKIGKSGVATLWQSRRVEEIALPMPVWKELTAVSTSEGEGAGLIAAVGAISPALWRHVSQWAKKWRLAKPWAYMVAVTTICEVARRITNGERPLDSFIIPNQWENWYQEQTGVPYGPESIKRPQRRRIGGDAVAWLVRRHFLQQTSERIAQENEPPVTHQAVTKATNQFARYVGIWTRRIRRRRKPPPHARTVRLPAKK